MRLRLICSVIFTFVAAAPAWADNLHAWIDDGTPTGLERWVGDKLSAQRASIQRMLAVKGPRTVDNTLQPYDDAFAQLILASNQANLMMLVGATPAIRDKAQVLNKKIQGVVSALGMNRAVYQALAAVPMPDNDPATRLYLERSLLSYRLGGIDKDQATRDAVHKLQDQTTALGLTFDRNVQDDTRTIIATKDALAGLPDDYIARHKPNADGTYTLSTDEPDSSPVFSFASNADLRHRMYQAYFTRAYPANKKVLLDLLAKRQRAARLLGFANKADMAMADQMIGNAANARKLLDEIDAASRDIKQKEYQQLLAFVQSRQPGTTSISAADYKYWSEQFKRERYAFDAQSVRPYFPYAAVEQGIIDIAARVFHVQFARVQDAKVWHPSVTVYDVIDQGRPAGRIYLDMHPREGKDKWYSASPVVPGVRGKLLPEGVLICNFPGGEAGDPGLMLYEDVVTYFHEFGHLMHHILGSQNRWSLQGGFFIENDFLEAPSQMLEEFFTSYSVISTFAKHYQTGETLPPELMKKMLAADAYGRGRDMQGQLFYATLSLNMHDRPAAQVDPDQMQRQLSERFQSSSYVEGNRMYASFTHLSGYGSNYYTYLLDKVIALDFYARFNREHPLDGDTTAEYRRLVIDPGATKPATQLVQDFLGRPQNMDALKAWMNQQFKN